MSSSVPGYLEQPADFRDPEWLEYFELLVRSILIRPDEPAVILLGHFAPQIQAQHSYTGPELLHTVVAQFYDIPHVSVKGVLYNDYLATPEDIRGTYYTDPVLANPTGHQLIADVLISYFQSQICAGWGATMGHAFDVPYMGAAESDPSAQAVLGVETDDASEAGGLAAKQRVTRVPQAMLSHRPSDILKFREVRPYCISPNDIINPLPPSHFYGSGWAASHPAKGDGEKKHYWYADKAGSRFRSHIEVNAGDVFVYYVQNPDHDPLGAAACWVDDNMGNAVELAGSSEDVHEPTPT